MAEEFESVELEISEDDILYYLVDEDGNEIGFVIEEDGQEAECYYEGLDGDEFELADAPVDDGLETTSLGDFAELADGEVVELEVAEEDIDHYLFDDEGNEIGFVIVEDGLEVECYYETQDDEPEADDASVEEVLAAGKAIADAKEKAQPYVAEKAEDHGYLHKLASIAGHESNKARKKAESQLEKVHGKASEGIDKATDAMESQSKKLKEKKDDMDLGITREGVKETTADLNAIAREGAETAKELKEAYDDIMDSLGFLVPKKVRRRLP